MPATTVDATSSTETPGALEWVHNQGNLTAGYILVATCTNVNGVTVTGVTYDGVAMAQHVIQVAGDGAPAAQIWGLAVAGKGAGAYDVVCTKSAASCSGGACLSMNNAAQAAAERDDGGITGTAKTTTDTLNTIAGDMCMDICVKHNDDNDTFTQGAGETEICDLDANSVAVGDAEFSASYEIAAGAATAMSATWQTNRNYCYCLVAIKFVAGVNTKAYIIG